MPKATSAIKMKPMKAPKKLQYAAPIGPKNKQTAAIKMKTNKPATAKFGVITTTRPAKPKASIQGRNAKTGAPLANANNTARFGVISTTRPAKPRTTVGADDRGGQNEAVQTAQRRTRYGTGTSEYQDRAAAGSKGPIYDKDTWRPTKLKNIQYGRSKSRKTTT